VRILHVLGSLDRGGAETWLVQVLRHIDRSKYQFDFLVHTEKPCAYDDEVRALGSRIIPCLSPSNPVKYARNFLRILRQYGPYDCVHSHVHHFSGFVLTLARIGGVNSRIAHSHSDTRALKGAVRRLYFSGTAALIKQNATRGLAVSAPAALALFGRDWSADNRWQICLCGVDMEPFEGSIDRDIVRTELKIPSNALVVGHVGRFEKAKNHTFIIDIAQQLCSARPDTVFLLVGDGSLRRHVESRVRALNLESSFRFLGVRSDVPRLMKGAMDVFLFPSRFEGLGLVLLEAQAAGLRSIVSDTIPTEVDVVAGAIQRLSLRSSPRLWADALLSAATKARNNGAVPAVLKRYTIVEASERLRSVYDSQNGTVRLQAVCTQGNVQ